jgi:hypothetical protein
MVKWDKRVTGKILDRSPYKIPVLKPKLKELFERNLKMDPYKPDCCCVD